MKRPASVIVAVSVALLFSSCSSSDAPSEADTLWLLLPQEFPDSLFAGYLPQKNSRGKPFFFKKTKTSLSGFSAVFEQKLVHAQRDTVVFTVQVSYARNEVDARAFYGNYLTIEEKLKGFVKKTDPKRLAVDDALLIQSDRLFYLAVRKNLILYFVQIENRVVNLETVTNKIMQKINYIERTAAAFRT